MTRRVSSTGGGGTARTLHDVARAAGVSIATVSNVVRGKTRLMSPATRAHVEAVIDRLDYRPNLMARALRTARRRHVGMLVIDRNPAFLADPFNTQLIAGLSNILSEAGHGALVLGCPEDRLAESFLIRNDEVDALAVLPSGTVEARTAVYRLLAGLARPIVVFQDRPDRFRPIVDPAGRGEVLFVRQDDEGAGHAMARRHLARGARRLAFLRPERTWPAMEGRLAGACRAFAEAGRPPPDEIVCGTEDLDDTVAAIGRHVAAHGLPDALMAGNDRMGIGALRYARDAGLVVPRDLRVTGFNAFEFRDYSTPVLTSARSPAYRMGELAAASILARLDRGRFDRDELVEPVELVEGETD